MRNWHFNHIDFSTYPHYSGDDLGVYWSVESTVFRLWAPTARIVELRLYKAGKSGKPMKVIHMGSSPAGIWFHEERENLENIFYTFKIFDGEWMHEVPDPYARAVGVNGHRGMMFNPGKTHPEGWENDLGPRLTHFTDWIIYEIHIRDFSISESSGIEHKGKYLGFTEENTTSQEGFPTGLDHLTEMGITHVHLMPVNDFQTVDEEFPLLKYNWGYDPQHYNSPEGSYSTDPFDGTIRIKELKLLVKALHDHNIGVILDVVYNHTWLTKGSVFNQTVPGYYYRQNPDGSFSNASGCGNEMATERYMVRKFIIDSLRYWILEYHIDGFRFDLMGVYDNETMRHIRYEVNKINPDILIFGEGWTADESPMPEYRRAVKKNISHLPGIAAFSDDMRDALKGNPGNKASLGFVSGMTLREESVKFGIVGAVWHPQIVYSYVESSVEPWASEPSQCVNYVSCHDNYTLYDKLKMSLPNAEDGDLRRRAKLAGAIILTAQGIPFLHAGVEFCRTKAGHGNSYRSSDVVNQLDWQLKSIYADVTDYFRKLIHLRRNHPVFRIASANRIRKNLNFCQKYQIGVISYCIDGHGLGDNWKQAFVIYNGNPEEVKIAIPEGNFIIIAREDVIEENGIALVDSGQVTVPPVSMMLLAR
jgi:pullulanase